MRSNKNNRWLENCYIVGVIAFITLSIFLSFFAYSDSMDKTPLRIIRYIVIAGMLIKIFCFDVRQYSLKRLLVTLMIAVIILFSSFVSDNRNLLWTFIVIMAAYGTDFRRVLKYVVLSEIIVVGLIVFSCVVGLTPDRIYDRSNYTIIRHSLGFKYATYPGLFLFGISIGWFYLRWERAKWYEYLLFLFLGLMIFILTDTRFEPFCVLVVVLFFWAKRYAPKAIWKNGLRFFARFSIILMAVASIIMAYSYNPNDKLMRKINGFTSDRLSLIHEATEQHGLTLFGSPIQWISISQVYSGEVEASEFNAVDNAYMRLLLNDGVFVFLLFVVLQYYLGKKSINDRDEGLQFVLSLIAFYSVLSPRMIELPFNAFLLLYPVLSTALYGRLEKGKHEKK